MSAHELENTLEQVQTLSAEVAQIMGVGRQAGRMPSLNEARRLDALSVELFEAVRALQALQTDDRRPEIQCAVHSAREALGQALNKNGLRSTAAAARQMSAYQRC